MQKVAVLVAVIGGGVLLAWSLVHAPGPSVPEAVPPAAPETMSVASTSVLFVGDLMFDRYIRVRLGTHGADHILGGVAPLLASADMVVGNLEGPITEHASVSVGSQVGDLSNTRFTFAPAVASILSRYGITTVSIGNNHIRDFGEAGVQSTTAALRAAGITYVGDPSGQSAEPQYVTSNGVTLAFISYSDFVYGDAARVRNLLARTTADSVIVLAHWGDEYEAEPPPRVRELAYSFVTAGADLIIGSHPHVVGVHEDWQGARIYYSLGNFVFDQYFSPAVRCGQAVQVTFTGTPQGVIPSFREIPIGMQRDGSTVLGCTS